MKAEDLIDDEQTIPETNLPVKDVANAVKKRGLGTPSLEKNSTATPTEIQEMIGNVLYWYKRTPVKSDDECADRLNEFFQHVHETGEIPTVEKMCLALGVCRQRVWDWKNGIQCNAARTDMIKKAYDIMAALDAELVSKNKIPQVTYIFRAKNFFGMSDQTQIVVTPNVPYTQDDTREVKDIIQALPESTDE